MLSDAVSALCVASLAALLFSQRLDVWHVCVMAGIMSVSTAFQFPAYSAAATLMVPRDQLGRASGLVQLAQALSQIAAPVIAGTLVVAIDVAGVLLADVASYLVSLTVLTMVRIPAPTASTEGRQGKGSIWREAAYGWRYHTARPFLFGLLMYFSGMTFVMAMAQVVVTPMILSFGSPAALGTILSAGGAGMLIGSVAMSAWGGPRHPAHGVLGFGILFGASLVFVGLRPSIPLVAVGVFSAFIAVPIATGCGHAIWLASTAPDVQGRVFAVRRMLARSMTPLAYLFAGPLADGVFEPLLSGGGRLSALSVLVGTGPGRGIGLFVVVLGLTSVLVSAGAYLSPAFRHGARVHTLAPESLASI